MNLDEASEGLNAFGGVKHNRNILVTKNVG